MPPRKGLELERPAVAGTILFTGQRKWFYSGLGVNSYALRLYAVKYAFVNDLSLEAGPSLSNVRPMHREVEEGPLTVMQSLEPYFPGRFHLT